MAPNLIYDYNVRQMNIKRKVKYINGQYGDLYDIWNGLHPQHYFAMERRRYILRKKIYFMELIGREED